MVTKTKKPKIVNKAYDYCKKSVRLKTTPKYVKLQMKDFIAVCDGKNDKFVISEKKLHQLNSILKILTMPKGLKAGQTLYECATGYQWLFYTAIFCEVYRDNPKKRRYETGVLEIARKNFKALALDTPIPTPDGWKTMGGISVGDIVFGQTGKPTVVIGESEIFDKPMYEVTFEDGDKIKASGDHIWTVKTKNSRRTARSRSKHIGSGKRYRKDGWYDITTAEMASDFVCHRKDGKGNEYKYRVPMNGSVEYEEKNLPIAPYLLGVWLGDGTSVCTNVTVSDSDADEMMTNVERASGYRCELHHAKNRSSYFKVDKQSNNQKNESSFIFNLKKLNLIGNKHIPRDYLQSSRDQRLELLKGLMDTDGSVSRAGECSFIQKSETLSMQVLELINSLGIKATIKKRKSVMSGREISDVYFISFFVDAKHSCFKLKRKSARLKSHLASRMDAKSITNIEPIDHVPSKCIMVSDPSHLYLAGRQFTPTHNTYTIATIFIVLFLTEPAFSKFYSVAPDGSLSREVREAIVETIKSSPLLYEFNGEKRFKLLRDYIMFKPTQTQYIPLSYSTNRMDGRLPNAFIADEVGALPNSSAINAMRSGQLNVLNKLGFVISTKYPTIDNPFEDEVSYSKKVLDGIEKDDTRFSLLYEPDKTKGWETDDLILQQANPASLENKGIWDDLVKKRAYAVAVESAREYFVTKNCNIIYQGAGTETYIDIKDVQECKVSNIDWKGRVVYLGLDLSETNDNTSVSMLSLDDDNKIYAQSFCFIPDGRITEKSVAEKLDYAELVRTGRCFACGDKVIDYSYVENFIMGIEEKYGVQIQAIGFDRWNALSTAQKLEEKGYNMVEVRQHSSVLHPPTKLLKEKILKKEFAYTDNKLLEINFQNARCQYDTNHNLYVSKKKSTGKVDMVVSIIDAMYLIQQDILGNMSDFVVQTF